MALIFMFYTAGFWFVLVRKRLAAFISLGTAIAASIGMFLYHADSALNLNF